MHCNVRHILLLILSESQDLIERNLFILHYSNHSLRAANLLDKGSSIVAVAATVSPIVLLGADASWADISKPASSAICLIKSSSLDNCEALIG